MLQARFLRCHPNDDRGTPVEAGEGNRPRICTNSDTAFVYSRKFVDGSLHDSFAAIAMTTGVNFTVEMPLARWESEVSSNTDPVGDSEKLLKGIAKEIRPSYNDVQTTSYPIEKL